MAASERLQHSGNAPETTLDGAINSSATSITVVDGTGYPDGAVGPFWIVIDPGLAAEEKIKCITRTGNSITVVTTPSTGRGGDSTTAVSHVSGAVVQHILSADELDKLNQHANDQNDNHPSLLNVTRHDSTSRHAVGTSIGAGSPGSSAVGDAIAQGVSTNVSRADHKHGRESFGSVGDIQAVGTASNGSAATPSRSDHRHPADVGTAVSVTTANATGTALTFARSDHRHDAPQHVRISGRSGTSLAGGAPPAAGTGAWLEQSGAQQFAFNGASSATLNFPAAFPNGLLSVQVTNCAPSVHDGQITVFAPGTGFPPSASGCTLYLASNSAGVNGASQTLWVSWTAKGW